MGQVFRICRLRCAPSARAALADCLIHQQVLFGISAFFGAYCYNFLSHRGPRFSPQGIEFPILMATLTPLAGDDVIFLLQPHLATSARQVQHDAAFRSEYLVYHGELLWQILPMFLAFFGSCLDEQVQQAALGLPVTALQPRQGALIADNRASGPGSQFSLRSLYNQPLLGYRS